MLKNCGSKLANTYALDLEGFKLNSIGFIIKELILSSSYYDTIFFKSSVSFKNYRHTINKLLFGRHTTCTASIGTTATCPNGDLTVTRVSDLPGNFFAKGTENCELMSKL